jgi:hypothetical protein
MSEMSSDTNWSSLEKIGFRFISVYFLLIVLFQNNGAFPLWNKIFAIPQGLLNKFIPWLGAHVYGITDEITIKITGSGDTLFDYLVVLTAFLISILASILWSVLDRKRSNYIKLYYWLTVAVRYYVGLMLISYGMVKVIQLQFPYPGLYRLVSTYGESSPMGLAWTFLGFSKGYNLFMGIAEILAGLLLFRRTMTFGAIITLMTAMNVMAVNYFYDVPVKILSTHLVLMTLFLLSRDIKRLTLFFFTNTHAKLDIIKRPQLKKGVNIAINSFKVLLIGYVLIYGLMGAIQSEKMYGSKAPKTDLYGLYEVTDFVINGDTITNYKNEKLWKSIVFQWEGSMQIRDFRNRKEYYGIEKDSLQDKLKLTSWSDNTKSYFLNYKKIDSTGLDFNFIFKGDTIYGSSKRLDEKDFLLTTRGFHWVSEYPFNR